MIVQIGFDYDINLDRILYAQHDHDTGRLKIIFDQGTILEIKDVSLIDEFEKQVKHTTTLEIK